MRARYVISTMMLGMYGLSAGALSASTVEIGYALTSFAKVDGATDVAGVSTPDPTASSNVTTLKGNFVKDTITATAVQNSDGTSFVEAEVTCEGIVGMACGGYSEVTTVKAQVDRTSVQRIDSVFSVGGGTMDFRVSGVTLGAFNAGGSDTKATVRFDAMLFVNDGGNLVDQFSANMTLTGSYNNFQITDASGFSGALQLSDCSFGVCNRGTVNVDPLSGSLNFGRLLFGDTLFLYTKLAVETEFTGTEVGASARAFDPNGTVVTTLNFQPDVPAIPLPATALLLASALAVPLGIGRRQQRAI